MHDLKRSIPVAVAIATLAASCGSSDSGAGVASTVATDPPPTTALAAAPTTAPAVVDETAEQGPSYPGLAVDDCTLVTEEVIVDEVFGSEDVICGYVGVPADWDDPQGDQIQLAVYVVPSTADTPAPDPVVYLEGGPGGAAAMTVGDFASGPAAYLRDRSDIILIDQRGTGYSIPALYCPEIGPDNLAEEHQACHDRFVDSGVDLADYNSVNNALDIDAVRQALGVDQWNLYGLSYGTRLALTSMRETPDGVRSVILDSVFPIQVNGISEAPYTLYWSIDQIAANCDADPDCEADAKSLIEDGIERLSENPLESFGAADYLMVLGESISDPRVMTLVETVAAGSDEDLVGLLTAMSEGEDEELPPLSEVPPSFYPLLAESVGMGYSVVCAEEAPFLDVTAGPAIENDFRPSTRSVVEAAEPPFDPDLCSVWAVPAADQLETEAVSSDIPTLILAGTADVATPPAWSKLTGETLSQSSYLEFPGLTHGLLGNNDCLNGLTRSFLDDPAASPDMSCIAELPAVDYEPTQP